MALFTRRIIDLTTPNGAGQVALLDFGDPARPVDIVFSHANGFNAFTYRHILEPLAADLRIIAYDLRGHGRTTLPAEPEGRADWRDLRDDLLALLEGMALGRPVVLAGHSFGGTFSLMAAETAPEAVKALVLFDPVLFPLRAERPAQNPPIVEGALRRRAAFASREAAFANWRGRGAFSTWPDKVLADYAADGLVESADGVRLACSPLWEASSYMAQGQDGEAILLASTHPTNVLKAQINSTCFIAADDPRLAANRLIDLTEIEGASHFLPMERPDLVHTALRRAAG